MPEINALGLLTVILASSYIIIKYGKCPPAFNDYLGGVVASVFVYLVIIYWYRETLNNMGSYSVFHPVSVINSINFIPYHQIIIPMLCIMVFVVFIQNIKLKIVGVTMLFICMIILSSHCRQITKRSNLFTYGPGFEEYNNFRQNQMRKNVKNVVGELIAADNSIYQAGWFSESGCIKRLPESDRWSIRWSISYWEEKAPIIKTTYEWYTLLTGIYHISQTPSKIWYPGGRLQDAVGKLEYHLVDISGAN